MVLTQLRQDTGYTVSQIRLGSKALQDEPLDMQVNQVGVYILAKIGSGFCQETLCTQEEWDNTFAT